MQISPINSYSNSVHQNRVGFKSVMPVIIKIGSDFESAAPVVGDKLNETFMRKTVLRLNNSLEQGIKPERDIMINKLRRYFGERVKDFFGKVTAYTCVDGELKDGVLSPYFYLLTGEDASKIEMLRESHKAAVAESKGYDTANLRISKDNYYNIGKNYILNQLKKFNPMGRGPEAFYVCYEPVRNTKGRIVDYEIKMAGFRPIENLKNPSIKLNKLG